MEQWTEQTSLRLLELIASSSIAGAADSGAVGSSEAPSHATACAAVSAGDNRPTENAAANVGQVLASLAEDDPRFQEWLCARWQCCDRAAASTSVSMPSPGREFDWQLIAEHWLAWVAAEPVIERAPPANRADESPAGQVRAPHALYRRVLVANARAALQYRQLVCECQQMRPALARELAYDMAYGLSHELNNPLANIATRARLLAEEEPSVRKRQLLAAIVDQAMRGCEMIADLMLIARPPVLDLRTVDLALVVRDAVAKARPWAEVRELSVILRGLDDNEALLVRSDPAALAEALGALLRNAIEAARGAIVVTLSLAASDFDRSSARMATVEVCDDGPGMSPHALAHALNPYFSGREAGRGLGIGLAKADRIAGLSGGAVQLTNAPGGGCSATLALPVIAR